MADRKDALSAAFAAKIKADAFLRDFPNRKKRTQADALEYAERLGDAASAALLEVLGADALADETLRREAAETLLKPLLREDFDAIQAAASVVQKAIDAGEGLGLNAVSAEYDKDRADGLAEKFTAAKDADTARSWLGEPVVNFHQHAYDAWVRENADFRYKAGLNPKIVRTGHAGMCPWCAGLAGTYDYESVRHGSDVFRRHQNCKCVVTFVNGRERQNVWSKKRWEDSPEVLERRRAIMPPKATPEEMERRKAAGLNFRRPAAGGELTPAAGGGTITLPKEVHISNAQFGKKIGRHFGDFGLNPSDPKEREVFREIIIDIFQNRDEVRTGPWRGQDGDVLFYIKGEDVLVLTKDGKYITTLKGGVTNARVKNAGKLKILPLLSVDSGNGGKTGQGFFRVCRRRTRFHAPRNGG